MITQKPQVWSITVKLSLIKLLIMQNKEWRIWTIIFQGLYVMRNGVLMQLLRNAHKDCKYYSIRMMQITLNKGMVKKWDG